MSQERIEDLTFTSETDHGTNDQAAAEENAAQESQPDATGDDAGTSSPVRPSNAVQTSEYTLESSGRPDYAISLPSVGLFSFNTKLRQFGNVSEEKAATLKDWQRVTQNSVDYYTVGALYQDRFEEKGSEFRRANRCQ